MDANIETFNASFTALATGLLVVVGVAQASVLAGQRRQQRLDWAEVYRRRWTELNDDWAKVVFLGQRYDSYYQVAQLETLEKLKAATIAQSNSLPTVWARESVRNVCGMLSDVCMRILQGQILIREVYPIFGTGLLRNGAALRALLDSNFNAHHLNDYGRIGPSEEEYFHQNIRNEVQTWLVCHDGIRRRCLILLDLLWAESARLEDLPPHDLQTAASAKKRTGHLNRKRLRNEALRLNGRLSFLIASRLVGHLRHAEYRRHPLGRGLNPKRLKLLEEEWTKRYLNDPSRD